MEEAKQTLVELDGKTYELKYNRKIVRAIEDKIRGNNLARTLGESQALISYSEMGVIVGFGLFTESGSKVSPEQGLDLVDLWLDEKGLVFVTLTALKALQRDCPFLLAVDEDELNSFVQA